jgi:glycosyltransferase involved in cell wall biosynthesis
MRILYSFNKRGVEAEFWSSEIASASNGRHTFVPFNHDPYVAAGRYTRAQLLDHLYFHKDPGLMRLYADFEARLADVKPDAVIVDNQNPYHPDYLRKISTYKVLRTTDGPLSAYDRDFAYLHAFDQILYMGPAYSADMGMREKLTYVGATNMDFWPLGTFAANHDASKSEKEILGHARDVDVVFVGALHLDKMPMMAAVKKAFGKRLRMYGLTSLKRNLYFNAKYGFPGWLRPLHIREYVPLYQRSKIGINIHLRGDYTLGSYRLFDLPANGVMQISDGGEYLEEFFRVGDEIVRYRGADELIDKVRWYLAHDEERQRIARNGYRRAMRDYRIHDVLQRGGDLIEAGMARIGWSRREAGRRISV